MALSAAKPNATELLFDLTIRLRYSQFKAHSEQIPSRMMLFYIDPSPNHNLMNPEAITISQLLKSITLKHAKVIAIPCISLIYGSYLFGQQTMESKSLALQA
ncbi:MAG: hypothetical protein LBE21_11005, partial [Pseudomonadales bacterium]|nr:hypothetical protein [Pseudomonadales bacterium]